MTQNNSKNNISLFAFIAGLIAGAAAVFAIPASKEEEIKQKAKDKWQDLKDKMNQAQQKAQQMSQTARDNLKQGLQKLKDAGTAINKQKYQQLVGQIVDDLSTKGEVDPEDVDRLKQTLNDDYDQIKRELT